MLNKIENLPLSLLILILIIVFLFMTFKEGFSSSGMTISDIDCMKLADVYYDPMINDPDYRIDARKRICGCQRRNTIDFGTGNFYTHNGSLL